MTWITTISSTFYYLALPVTTIVAFLYAWFVRALAPVLHLAGYFFSALLLPVRVLGKFETLYIYLGVAAVIGVVTGAILHLSSTILVSIFDLASTPDKNGTIGSSQSAREHRSLEEAWQSSSSRGDRRQLGQESSLEKQYAEWQGKDAETHRDKGVSGQTILEEDDSDDF